MSIIYDMPDEVYHSRPELSSTGARLLLESPAEFKYRQDHPQPGKRDYDIGHAAHSKVLGVGSGVIGYPEEHLTPSGNVSTKAATVAWAEEQRAAGLVPVSPADVAAVDAMAEAVLSHPKAREILELDGHREVSVFNEVDGVPTRARLDVLAGDVGADLKTTRKKAHAEGFSRESGELKYFVQETWYRDALSAEGIELSRFVFIAVEKTPPYLVGVNEHDIIFREMGKTAASEARARYRHGVENNDWPGYSEEIELASPPAWMAMLYEDLYGSEIQV